jgi:hypothetical protein
VIGIQDEAPMNAPFSNLSRGFAAVLNIMEAASVHESSFIFED